MTAEARPQVAVVVATLGTSDLLEESLEAIGRQRKSVDLELIVVSQGTLNEQTTQIVDRCTDRHIRCERPIGFAAANNRALQDLVRLESAAPEFIALINDDAIIDDTWLARLIAQLQTHPQVGAAQGLNLIRRRTGISTLIDGAGIRWSPQRQAVQIGHCVEVSDFTENTENPENGENVRMLFGVSATAAVFRVEALQSAIKAGCNVFEESLDTYYEDVDLACRLQRSGWSALCDVTVRCEHAGSSSAPKKRQRLLIANRHLVLARHLGRGYLPSVPALMLRDLRDFGVGALRGWARAARLLPRFLSWHAAHPLEAVTSPR